MLRLNSKRQFVGHTRSFCFQFLFHFCCYFCCCFFCGRLQLCFFFPMCSLRVNLDMGKSAYGWMIMKDENIPGTVVRTSTIPEELGRLVYLLTDKTGRRPNIQKKSHIYMRFFGRERVQQLF